MTEVAALAARIRAGEQRAAARLMRRIDDADPSATDVLRALFPHTGRAWVVGLTGSPGAGKSSLTARLIAHHRRAGRTVGVVAVDPSSPFSGGAILGDRIRMQEHATDPGVFIRSLATRGALGGLSRSTAEVIRVLDAMGKDVVLVETVGVGQDEIDIASLAHTTVVVVVPGMGDDVQAIKAGILEVADVFAINKADREGADRTERDLRQMLELRHATAPMPGALPARDDGALAGMRRDDASWEPPIARTVATRDDGTEALAAAIDRHRAHLEAGGGRLEREAVRARAELLVMLRERVVASALRRLEAGQGRLAELAVRIAERKADPWAIVDEVVAKL